MFDVIDDICCLHAQLLSSAELSLWARLEGFRADTLETLLWEDRTLVKTWAIRGTLHVIPAHSYPTWQAALSTYQHYLKNYWLKHFGFTREQLERMLPAVGNALSDTLLTREELAVRVAELAGDSSLEKRLIDSWGATLKPASFRGHLCFGPNSGKNVRFTNPATWLGHPNGVPADVAIEVVARRYLAAYGPATREDFARWWGCSPAAALKLIKAVDGAVEVDVEGELGWMLLDDAETAADAKPGRTVNLLPAFDPWVIGASRHTSAHIADAYRDRVYRQQGWISPVVLINGRMEGIWKHEIKGTRIVVDVSPFADLPSWTSNSLKEEAERLASFLGGTLELNWV